MQRGLLAQYHITNPVDSYNGKGKWAVPTDPFGPARPAAVLRAGRSAGRHERCSRSSS